MKKRLLLIATISAALSCAAQETMYLIKGDQVIAKYGIDQVDYAAFELPDGVKDIPDGGEVRKMTYLSAPAVYLGTVNECGQFQIQLSSKEITDENPPLSFLYLQFSTPRINDLANIKIAEGVYTVASDPEAPEPFTFYAGQRMIVDGVDQAGGSLVIERPDNATMDVTMVVDGQFSVRSVGEGQYTLTGLLKLAEGDVLDFSYTGPLVITNESSEQLPAEELPLPESKLTADRTFTPLTSEGYGTVWESFFADAPQFDYFYILLYEDNNYANCLQLALLVDREKYPETLLPAGKYPMVGRFDNSLNKATLATYPAFLIKGETTPQIEYGCWLTEEFSDMSPLVGGVIEVLEDTNNLNNVKLKITLNDNAATPHTVSASFAGSLQSL